MAKPIDPPNTLRVPVHAPGPGCSNPAIMQYYKETEKKLKKLSAKVQQSHNFVVLSQNKTK